MCAVGSHVLSLGSNIRTISRTIVCIHIQAYAIVYVSLHRAVRYYSLEVLSLRMNLGLMLP